MSSSRGAKPGIERLIDHAAHATHWDALRQAGEASVQRVAETRRVGTIGDALRLMNQRSEREDILSPYLRSLLPIAGDGSWAGPDMVANWYRRNFRIAANILAIAEDGDRLIVIYGAGHIPVLEHTLSLNPRFRMHDPLRYLTSA